VKEGYSIDFVVEYNDSFSKAKRKFVKGPQKRMLEEISLWIKMLFMEKGLMCMEPDRMVDSPSIGGDEKKGGKRERIWIR
jgi:hypothetical protein